MKKSVLALILFCSVMSFGQTLKVLDFETLQNSVTKTKYIDFADYKKIDSISVIAVGYGEVDVDSVDIYVGVKTPSGVTAYSSVVNTSICTLDLAASVSGAEALLVSNATKLTGAVLRGGNALKVVTRGSTSGCAAGNWFKVAFRVWGEKN